MKPREWLSITLSVFAFALSAIATYYNVIRQTDDIRVLIVGFPIGIFEHIGPRLALGGEYSAIFTNGGNRPAAIIGVVLLIRQEHEPCNKLGSTRGIVMLSSDLEGFVIKENEVVTKKFRFVSVALGSKDTSREGERPTMTEGIVGRRYSIDRQGIFGNVCPLRPLDWRMKPPKDKSPPVGVDQRFELLVKAVTDYAIYMLDPSGHIASWNAGAERMKGYSEAEVLGKHFSLFFGEADRAAGKPAHALEVARKTGRFEGEGWRYRKDGGHFWALAVIDAIHDESGKLICFAKITRDISDRHAAEESLRESERQFRLLVTGVRDYAIYMLDPGGNIANWNPGAELIKGYSAQEVVGTHFSRFFTAEDRASDKPAKALAAAAEKGKFETEGWRVRKDGTRFWAMVVIDAIYDEQGALVGFAKVTRDITERRDAEEHLKQTREQLFQSQKMEAVGQLTGGVAHDFNNLLTVIMGNLEIARDSLESGREGAAIRALRAINSGARGAQRAATLTQRLLSFSRRQALEPKAVDANKVAASAAEFLQQSIGENIHVEMVRAGGLWRIEADPTHLETAIFNVALNARDAMDKGGRLTIETANACLDERYCAAHADVTPGQYVQIAISDTGHGMSKEVVERAFEPFFTTKRVGHGTGLGLSQVYGFVKQSGGHVRIYSEPGQGTTVKLYLPRLFNEGEAEAEVELQAAGGVGETILVVEDDQDVREYVVELVTTLHYRVLSAADADAALAILDKRAEPIDLMLTDVVLPGTNGRQLAEQVHARFPDMKILFMTGYSRNAIVHHGRLDPGVDMIQKPFTRDAISLRIRELLDRQKKAAR